MNAPVRTSIVETGEVFVNMNDLIIHLMVQITNAASSHEAETIKKVVDYLVAKRDKAHGSH